MKPRPMLQQVQPNEVLSHGQLGKAAVKQMPLQIGEVGEKKAEKTEEGNAAAAKLFCEAVSAYPKAAALAAELGVTEAYISQFKSGERTIPLRAIFPLLKNPESARVLIGAQCDIAEIAHPRPRVTVTREQVDAKTAQLVRRTVTLWKLIKSEVAAELGADEEQVDLAIEVAE